MLSQVKLKSFPWHGQYEGDRLGAIFGAAWELVLFLVLLLMFQIRFFIMVQSKLEIWYNFWWRCCFSKLGAFFYRGDQKCYLQLLADRWKWTSRESITFLEKFLYFDNSEDFPNIQPKKIHFSDIWPQRRNSWIYEYLTREGEPAFNVLSPRPDNNASFQPISLVFLIFGMLYVPTDEAA